jgi:ribosome-associated protein
MKWWDAKSQFLVWYIRKVLRWDTELKEVMLHTEFITLGQLLKIVGEVNSGGEVKEYLREETPLVNGERENRRGRKLRPGDVVVLKHQGEIKCVGAC